MESGRQGHLNKSQLPNAMGNLFPTSAEADHPWWWKDSDLISITYLTPETAAAALLPSEFSLLHMPVEGLVAVMLTFAKYRGGTLEPYNEVFLQIPCLYEDRLYLYIPSMYVTTDQAMASGRELAGFPKKLAMIQLDSSGAQFTGALERHGRWIGRIAFTQGQELFSLPLPAQERIVVPAPFDQTLVLPGPSGKPQGLPLRVATTRYIPGVVAPHHIESCWRWEQGTVWAGEGSIAYAPSDTESLVQLPVVGVVASLLFRGDFALYGGQVLTDMA